MSQILYYLSTLLAASILVRGEAQIATVYIQPVVGASLQTAPAPLAEIAYDLAAVSEPDSSSTGKTAEVASFEPPELPDEARLARIGVLDPKTGAWVSPTSLISVENFSKGYALHFVLSLGRGPELEGQGEGEMSSTAAGDVVGVSCRGVRVDAGATRDFGPQAVVVVAETGRQPVLNKPVVLNAEGKQQPPPEEKTLLQKYWWVIGIVLFMVISGGGPEQK